MRKRFWRIAGWSALILLAVLAFCGYRIVFGKPFTINQLANRQALEFLMLNPELFTAVGITDGSILDRHSDKLTPYTVGQRDEGYVQFERFLREVRWFDRAHLARQDEITYDVLIDQYQSGGSREWRCATHAARAVGGRMDRPRARRAVSNRCAALRSAIRS